MAVEYTDNLGVKRRVEVEDISKQKGTGAEEKEGEGLWFCKCSGSKRLLKRDESCPLCGRTYEENLKFESRWF